MILDKIYIHIGPHLGLMQATKIPVGAPDEKEFISKDALLKWANNLKDKWCEPPESKHSAGCVYMLEQVIKKLESL